MRTSIRKMTLKLFLVSAILICFALASKSPAFSASAYPGGVAQCQDLDGSEWYYGYAQSSLELGLFESVGQRFCGDKNMTYSECGELIAKLCNDILGIQAGGAYYENNNKYLPGQIMNRGDFIDILTSALPDDLFPQINDIASVAGVQDNIEPGKNVAMLYRAGVLVGDGPLGYFSPFRPLTRAEAAAIAVRVVFPERRYNGEYIQTSNSNVSINSIDFGEDYLEFINDNNTSISYNDGLIYCLRRNYQPTDNLEYMSAFFDSSGHCVLEPSERYFYQMMQDGMIVAQDGDGIFHIFNREGGYIETERQVFSMTSFSEGLSAVKFELGENEPAYIINKEGETVKQLPGGYDLTWRGPRDGILLGDTAMATEGIGAVVSIESGEVKAPGDDFILTPFEYGFARMYRNERDENGDIVGTLDDRLVDKDLQVVIPNSYGSIVKWNDSYIVVSNGGKSGIINYNNEIVVPIEYANVFFEYWENKNIVSLVVDGNRGNNYVAYKIIKDVKTEEVVAVVGASFELLYDNIFLLAYSGKNRFGVTTEYYFITDIYGNCLTPMEITYPFIPSNGDNMPERIENRKVIFRTDEGYFSFAYGG